MVVLVKAYPVFDFLPDELSCRSCGFADSGIAVGPSRRRFGIAYRIRMAARFRGCSREIRGDFVILFYNLRISFSIGWLILIRAISEVE